MRAEQFVASYRLTPSDWRAYYRFIRPGVVSGETWDRRGWFRLHVWGVALCAGLLGLCLSGQAVDPAKMVVVGVAASCLGLLYGHYVWPKRGSDEASFMADVYAEPYANQEHLMTLTADEIEDITPLARVAVKWSLIRRVERTAEHVFIVFARDQAFCVPIRAFPDAAAAESFCNGAMRFAEADTRPGRALGFPVLPPASDEGPAESRPG